MLRTDSIPKVTGAARYVEDMVMPGMLHGAVLRSPHHHARLISAERRARAEAARCVGRTDRGRHPGENGLGDYSQEEPVCAPSARRCAWWACRSHWWSRRRRQP